MINFFYNSLSFSLHQNTILKKRSYLRLKCSVSTSKDVKYDVIVIGAGHAGCEAALSCCARGISTLLLTLNLDKVAWQPCNPSIGGPAKSTLVHEVDALGGWIGKLTDRTYLHKRILNNSKGPAVWSLRAQTDKREYSEEMKKILDETDNLTIREGMAFDIILNDDKKIKGIKTYFGGLFECKAVIITTGTFLGGAIWVGSKKISAGRAGEMASFGLTESLKNLNFELGRLKTGTPPRIDSRFINFSLIEKQPSDIVENWFSFDNLEWNSRETLNCYISHTTTETLSIIRKNLHLSPKYGGFMKSTGPRYCPSIEDKIVRFNQKLEHQIFLEPEGRNINEIYIQGMSTGLPENLQNLLLKTIPGLENTKMVRPAYSVDYDYIIATQLDKNLMSNIPGLFFAGQVCGTTGYEEAAAQGWLAGLNAALYSDNKPMLSLSRDGSFIGTMIDDLCTKQLKEPYRVLTSRSEFRLLLRGDNADFRLTPLARKYNLISDRRWQIFKDKFKKIQEESLRINNTLIKNNSNIKKILEFETKNVIKKDLSFAKLLSRPQFSYEILEKFELHDSNLNITEAKQLEIEIKYLSYIERQENQIKNIEKILDIKIEENLNFMKIIQISKEGREKLTKKRPYNLREACLIGGISSSDIQTLLLYMKN
uniref:tRNA uridine 5-carboxymethylaminomethyl modification enzyme C-terminal subdomain domain-containing protein n=1 Tax=Cryptomonas curvata TaxID=233186 RepID=A0A7S0M7L8_9CRYP|nr:glucose inhibited division protein A [Cryptomonas curvata]|mmetsp:Transcript_28474/g.59525  ORF Transcript_28474/g.59525 Transcript_28474/m.59525 type:complete len:653 (+) Transcript_28474:264-2222(+)